MNILLDTHVIIWALSDDPRLNSSARELILNPKNVVYYSTISLWEIAIKNFKAPEKCPYNESLIDDLCIKSGFLCMDIKAEHIKALRYLRVAQEKELSNHDPFDRMLISQAKLHGARLLSHDGNFANYSEPCILMF